MPDDGAVLAAALHLIRQALAEAENDLRAAQDRVDQLHVAAEALVAVTPDTTRVQAPTEPGPVGLWSVLAQIHTGQSSGSSPRMKTSDAVLLCLAEAGEPLTVDELVAMLLERRWLRLDRRAPREMVYQSALRLSESNPLVVRSARGKFQYLGGAQGQPTAAPGTAEVE